MDILKSLNWIGFANLEFKYDIGKNKYLFIEINPRVWQQIDLAEKLNLNFPFLYFNTLTNKPNPPSKEAVNEKKWMDIAPDFLACIKLLIHKKIKIKEWWSSIKNIVSFGLYTPEDKKPFLYSINYGLIIFTFPFTLIKLLRK